MLDLIVWVPLSEVCYGQGTRCQHRLSNEVFVPWALLTTEEAQGYLLECRQTFSQMNIASGTSNKITLGLRVPPGLSWLTHIFCMSFMCRWNPPPHPGHVLLWISTWKWEQSKSACEECPHWAVPPSAASTSRCFAYVLPCALKIEFPLIIKLRNMVRAHPSERIVLATWSVSCCRLWRYFCIATNISYQVLLSETHILLPAVTVRSVAT